MANNLSQEREFEHTIKERGFNLPLPTRVIGQDPEGKNFEEQTSLSYISHQGSSFWLNTIISEGCDLKLIIDLPPKLSQHQNLKLIIKGKVIFIEAATEQNPKQRISIKFENKYIIMEED